MEKLCIFCKHIRYYEDWDGEYSDPSTWRCEKDRWPKSEEWPRNGDVYANDLADLRAKIIIAQDCPDYAPPK